MLSAELYLEFSLQLSVHSALASSLARLMLQFYAGVRSCIFSIFRIFNVTFSVCFFFLVPPIPHWLAAMGEGGTSPRAEYRNFGDLRTDG